MIWRVVASAGATLPIAAAAAERVGTPHAPVVWDMLGYQFEAGSMIAALCACLAVRFYVAGQAAEHRWTLDVPVSALALMFTAGMVVTARPAPLVALLFGTGLGAVGAGIIKVAKRYVDRWFGDDSDEAGINRALKKLNDVPPVNPRD